MAAPVYSGSRGLPPPPVEGTRVLTRPEAQQMDRAQASIDEGLALTEKAGQDALRIQAEESLRQREAAAAARAAELADPQAYAQGTIGAANADFDAALGALGARAPTHQAPRPFYEPTREYTDRMGQLIPESQQAFQGQQDAELGQARESLAITEDMAARQQEMLVDMRARDHAEAQRRTEAMQRVTAAQNASRQAADDFAAHAEVDPRRGWTSKPAGMKFLAVLSAGLLGAAGMDPFAHIQSAIQEDIAAQQANIAKRAETAQQRAGDVQSERSVYGDFVAQLGDERSAALAYENARLQQFMTQMSGRLQAAGIQTLTAEQQQIKNQFEQQIAANNLELGKRIEANTPTVTVGGGPALNSDQRRLVSAAGKQALTDRSGARESIAETAGRRETEAGALRVAQAKVQGESSEAQRKELRGEGGIYREAQQFAKEYGPQLAVIGQIDAFLEEHPGDHVPGISRAALGGEYESQIGDVVSGDEMGASAKVHNALGQIREEIGRARSQGAITEDEEKRFTAQVMDGLQVGGVARLKSNLIAVRSAMESRVQPGERALSPEGREYILRNKLIPSFTASRSSASYNAADPAAAREDP